jgi:stress-induced morphogen
MIDDTTMTALIRAALPDAEVQIWDRTGTMDHFDVLVRSSHFAGKSLLDRHRTVEKALATARADGRIHALAIRTELRENH